MSDHISLMMHLHSISIQINAAQAMIDRARADYPTDNEFQLELDRQQTKLDKRRADVELIKFTVSCSN